MTGFALCHGWGFDADAMDTFARSLRLTFPHAEFVFFDIGFTGKAHTPSAAAMAQTGAQWIAVGHSYGFPYLLQQPVPWKAAISVNGFTRFCRRSGKPEGMPARLLDAMIARLETQPQATVAEFWERCGDAQALSQNLDVPLLGMHLKQLRELDMPLPSCPVLALSTQADLIVPLSLTAACFSFPQCTMHEYEGSHLQLLQAPQPCINALAAFVEACRGE